jgi:hypothetical protein
MYETLLYVFKILRVCQFHVNKEVYWFLNRPPPFLPRSLNAVILTNDGKQSLINTNRFALLTFIIPPIMGSQDSNLNFKLLSSFIILNIEAEPNFHHWSRHAHRQRIALWVISLVLATQHTYIQSMLNLARFISFLLYKSLLSITKSFWLDLVKFAQSYSDEVIIDLTKT